MLRITTGVAKNRRLIAPEVPGFRAVQEIAKQALFSVIGEKITDARCLDLFAGSGNLGLEALSRGASWCDFVDENYDAIGAVMENIKKCGFTDMTQTFRLDAVKYVTSTEDKYDLVFIDPFYNDTSHVFLMKNLKELLNEGGLVAFFHGSELDIQKIIGDSGFNIVTQRKFGKSFLTILC